MAQSGITDIRFVEKFKNDIHRVLNSGNVQRVYLDLYRHTPDEGLAEAHRFAQTVKTGYPFLTVENILPLDVYKRQRNCKTNSVPYDIIRHTENSQRRKHVCAIFFVGSRAEKA